MSRRDTDELVMQRNYGTNLVHGAAMSVENISVFLTHMLAMPVWEQGGSEVWPLAAKQEEVGWCVYPFPSTTSHSRLSTHRLIAGLKLMGWCWPDYKRHIIAAESDLVHLAAQAEAARPRPSTSVSPPSGLHSNELQHHQQQQLQQPMYVSTSSHQYTGDTLDQAQHQMYVPTASDTWQPTYSAPSLPYSPQAFVESGYAYDGTNRSGTSSAGQTHSQHHPNAYLPADVEPTRAIPQQYYDPSPLLSPSLPGYLRYSNGATNYEGEL